MTYAPVIGLEVHVELKTDSKMFCGCSADYFGKDPNTHTCPVCLGMPGALPVPNKKAIEWCVMIGLALDCQIPLFSKFDRKNYFYPDLPKGYQISQYDQPFCVGGSITLSTGKKIGITRAHMEEDTAKLTHSEVDGEKISLIDFNRSGVPLVEIVTEPDFESAEEVVEYLKRLQQLVRHLGVSNADMEKGDMRLEPNISLRGKGKGERGKLPKYHDSEKPRRVILPNYKVEVKNINSFRFVGKAIEYEIKRQSAILDKGETPAQETRGWSETTNSTVSQRSKEEAHDYRYFPEPDIPPIRWDVKEIEKIRKQIPELADQRIDRFQKDYGLSKSQAAILVDSREVAEHFEKAVEYGKEKHVSPVQIANQIINKHPLRSRSEESIALARGSLPFSDEKGRKIDVSPEELVDEIVSQNTGIISDQAELEKLAKEAIEENPKAVEDFKKGNQNALQAIIGAVMKKSAGKADTRKVREILEGLLAKG